MKSFFALPIALLATMGAAQDSACGAEYIVDACLTSENAKFAACSESDWNCKCAAYEAIITCFNNCPNDSRRNAQEGQKTIFCGYASQFPSSTASTASKTGSAAAATATTASTTTSGSTASTTATGTAASATSSQTGAAADLVMNAGGIMAVVAALVVAVL